MGLRKAFFRIFHPNKIKRPFEQAAENELKKTNLQAIQEKDAAKKRRDDNLAILDSIYKKAKEAYDVEYNNEMAQITTNHTQKHAEYLELINNLALTTQQYKSQIDNNFNTLKDQILANQQIEEARLAVCIQKAKAMHCTYKKHYNNNKALLANLWNEITTQMLHQDCVTGYEQLKQSTTQYIVKTKCYSLLVGYFKQLATKHIISNDDFTRYKKFLHAICNTDNQAEHNIEFCTIDLEITNLLTYLKRQDEDFVSLAYKQDRLNNQTNYNNSREFNNLLSNKFAETTQEIADKYKKVLLNLTNELDQKNKDLAKNYTTIKQQIETEWYNHEHTYNAYITSLNENKASIERQLVEKEQQEKDKINDNYQQELKSIDDSVKEITAQVNSNLKEQLKQLRRAARASVINMFASISTAIAAYFSGGLLSGFSNYIVEGVKNSLIATSLGSLESLIKDKEKIGAKFVFNFPQGPTHDFTPEVARSATVQKQETPDFSANLAKLKEEFSIFNQRVHTWQTQAEHDLFYSLNRGMFFRPNFANAVAVYSSQSYNFNFGIDAELGQLQPNGYRNVRWNISLDNNRWYGDNLMRDRDVRNIIQQITNNSESLLNNNWLRPQRLSFNSTFNENSSNWLKSFSHNYIPVSNKKPLEVSLGEKLLILTGGAMVNAWSGIKQGAYMAGERLGILTPDTTLNYTNLRNQELRLYNSTPVGQSALRPWVEFGTGMLLYSTIPVAAYGRMGLLANGALSGGIIAGLQFTEDGQLSSRLENSAVGAAVGAGVGVAVNKVGGPLLRLYDLRQAQNFNKQALASNFGSISKTNKLKPSFFTPAFNEIKAFSVKSAFDGRLYPKNKLASLVKYLEKRGVNVYGTEGTPRFLARKTGVCDIYLPEQPTALQVKHELSHWLDYKNLGFDKYSRLSRSQREQLVLERLQKNQIWNDLNALEKEASTNYVADLIRQEGGADVRHVVK